MRRFSPLLVCCSALLLLWSSACQKTKQVGTPPQRATAKKASIDQTQTSKCLRTQVSKLLSEAVKRPEGQRAAFLLQGLQKQCTLPPLPHQLLKLHHTLREPTQGQVRVPLPRPFPASFAQYWRRACPNISVKQLGTHIDQKSQQAHFVLYDRCKRKGPRLLKRQELTQPNTSPGYMYALVLYQWFIDAGVLPQDAKRFLRMSYMSRPFWAGVRLLVGQSTERINTHHFYVVRPDALLHVPRDQKPVPLCSIGAKGSQEQCVRLFAKALKKQKADHQNMLTHNKALRKMEWTLGLVIAPKTPFSLVRRLLKRARRLGVKKVAFRSAFPWPRTALLDQPGGVWVWPVRALPKAKSKRDFYFHVEAKPKGLVVVTRGNVVPRGCVLGPGGRSQPGSVTLPLVGKQLPYKALRKCLQKLKKYFPSTREYTLEVKAPLYYKEIFALLEAARPLPKGCTSPSNTCQPAFPIVHITTKNP